MRPPWRLAAACTLALGPLCVMTAHGAGVCPVLDSRHWHAWIDRPTEASRPARLHVRGQIDMPTPGYAETFTPGPMDRRSPPTLRIRLEATAPEGIVLQVIDTRDVAFSLETEILQYRAVLIMCGDQTLAEMLDVTPLE